MSNSAMQIILVVVMLAIAALSGLGVGSGGLFIIFLTSFLHFSPSDARISNLLFFIISSLGAFFVHSMRGKIRYRLLIFVSSIGIIGTLIGTGIGTLITDSLLRFSFGILLLISGIATVFGKKIRFFFENVAKKRKNAPFKL